MRRRDFLSLATLSLSPLAAPGAERVRRIAWVSPAPSPSEVRFREELARLGWTDSRNVVIEARHTEAGRDALRAQVEIAVREGAEIVVTAGSSATLAAKSATTKVPIVAAGVTDPVGLGMVRSLVRPEGNLTGVSNRGEDTSAKKMELLTTLVPVKRIGIFFDPTNDGNVYTLRRNQVGLEARGLTPVYLPVSSDAQLDVAMKNALQERIDAVSVGLAAVLNRNHARLAAFALSNRLPSAGSVRHFVEAGGLMSFGQDYDSITRTAAIYVDKILRGTKVADLPFQQADKLEFGLNLKTARALGLTLPRDSAARADFVIE